MNDIITDPAFTTFGRTASFWELEHHQSVRLSASVVEDTLKINQVGAVGVHWHGEFRFAPFPVRSGEVLHLAFQAKAEQSTGFSVWIGQYRSPWLSLLKNSDHFGKHELTEDWTSFSFTAEIQQSEKEARLNFVFGEKDNVIWLRGISLQRTEEFTA